MDLALPEAPFFAFLGRPIPWTPTNEKLPGVDWGMKAAHAAAHSALSITKNLVKAGVGGYAGSIAGPIGYSFASVIVDGFFPEPGGSFSFV